MTWVVLWYEVRISYNENIKQGCNHNNKASYITRINNQSKDVFKKWRKINQ